MNEDCCNQEYDYSQLDTWLNEGKPLLSCLDYAKFAHERITERIPPKADRLETAACITQMSVESLYWLITNAHTLYEEVLTPDKERYISPLKFHNRELFKQFWVYEVVKAQKLASQFPLDTHSIDEEGNVVSSAPDYELNPDFKNYWPKNPGSTAFYSAGSCIAVATRNALKATLMKSCLQNFPVLPNHQVFNAFYGTYDKDTLMKDYYKTDNVMPLIVTWQTLSSFILTEYFPPDEWTQGKLEREYSRIISLLEHEYNLLDYPTTNVDHQESEDANKNDQTEQNNKSHAKNIKGKPWREVKDKAEKYVKKHGYPGQNKLAKILGCSSNTIKKAIGNSDILQEAKVTFRATPPL